MFYYFELFFVKPLTMMAVIIGFTMLNSGYYYLLTKSREAAFSNVSIFAGNIIGFSYLISSYFRVNDYTREWMFMALVMLFMIVIIDYKYVKLIRDSRCLDKGCREKYSTRHLIYFIAVYSSSAVGMICAFMWDMTII